MRYGNESELSIHGYSGGVDYSKLPVTQRDVDRALDGARQFPEMTSVNVCGRKYEIVRDGENVQIVDLPGNFAQ